MDIQLNKEGHSVVLTVSGRMDAVTAPEFEKRIHELVAAGDVDFTVNFEVLDYISSAGLRALFVAAKLIKSKQGRFRLVNFRGTVKEVLELSGLLSILQTQDPAAGADTGSAQG